MTPGFDATQSPELLEVLSFWWSPVCEMRFRTEDVASLFKVWAAVEHFHLTCFDCLSVGPDSERPVFCSSWKAGSLLAASLQSTISLWDGLFYHRSHRVGR